MVERLSAFRGSPASFASRSCSFSWSELEAGAASMRQTLSVTPETRYATTTDGVRIAFQVFGEGGHTLVLCLGMISCVDYQWEVPEVRDALERMARFARVVVFDRRGAGSSDRFSGGDVPPLELGVEDVGAVLAETGDREVCLWGHYDGALVAALYAATHPERVRALVLHCPEPYARQSPDWPWGWNEEEWAANVGAIAAGWGTVEHTRATLQWVAPSLTPTTARLERMARYFRLAGSPPAMAALQRVLRDTDIRAVLPSIQAPTLITHRGSPEVYAVEVSRYVAEQIPYAGWSSWMDPTSPSGPTQRPSVPRSRSSCWAHGPAHRPTGFCRPCCSPTSSTPRHSSDVPATAPGPPS